MAHAKLTIEVDFDPNKTDSEGLATAFDGLLKTAMCIPGVMDEYGEVNLSKDGFLCPGQPSPSGKIAEWLDKGKLEEEIQGIEDVDHAIQAGAKVLERWLVDELIGEPVFKADDGKWYTIRAIAVVDEVPAEKVEELPLVRVKGTVTESLVVQKEVSVKVKKNASKEEIEEAIRAKAYEKNILQGDHGWEGIETSGVDIDCDINCKYCGQDCFGNGGQGCDEAQAGGFPD